jgi:hypothetical protein
MTNRTAHAAALAGTAISTIGALTPSDWAHIAAALSGFAAASFYAVKTIVAVHGHLIRIRRRRTRTLSRHEKTHHETHQNRKDQG